MVLFEFFGLGGVFGLVLGNNTLNDTQQMRQMSMMGMDTGKAFKSVKENLEMIAPRERDRGGGGEKSDGYSERVERREFVYESQESGAAE